MILGIAILAIVAICGIAALVLIARSNIDKRRESIGARLRSLTAPTQSKAVMPGIEVLSPDPWMAKVPERYRGRADKILGSTGYTVTLRTRDVAGRRLGTPRPRAGRLLPPSRLRDDHDRHLRAGVRGAVAIHPHGARA